MDELKQRILSEGQVLSDSILKVDSFLNHQIDPTLMHHIGQEFARRFSNEEITKVLTVESSGIAVALMTGLALKTPVIFAKKKKATTMDKDVYVGKIYSFTRREDVYIAVAKRYLSSEDKVLIVDDFLATGEAAQGMLQIVEQAGAKVVGVGIAIEKAFQKGGEILREKGIRLETLVQVTNLSHGQVEL
ncbi:MAG: xanthine phosphoribosyltransferase [Clostridia bacterium]|jgi:xanthine phosphoribosyltransferase|nr:xanthine phosphoribosyltransferase [Clostridiales bacterium]MDK2984776.1 xanthine phosphoribosyltransferase [Clostridia bacterium]